MNIDFVARKVELNDQIRQLTRKKLAKVEKYFNQILEVRAEFSQERHLHQVELYIKGKDFDARATAQHKDLRSAIQEAVDRLENQAMKAKTRLKNQRGKKRTAGSTAPPDWSLDVIEPESIGSGTPRIVTTKTISVKPMTIDEAVLQLEDSSNDFIVFLNAASGKVNVLYRRRDNNLGLITPELST